MDYFHVDEDQKGGVVTAPMDTSSQAPIIGDLTNVTAPRPTKRPTASTITTKTCTEEGPVPAPTTRIRASPVVLPSVTADERLQTPISSQQPSPLPVMTACDDAPMPQGQPAAPPQAVLESRMATLVAEMNTVMAQLQQYQQSQMHQGPPPQPTPSAPLPTQMPQPQQQLPSPWRFQPVQQCAQNSNPYHSTAPRNNEQRYGRPSQALQQRRQMGASSPSLERACIVLLVEFKRQRIKKFVATEFIAPGQYVIVDGDRGEDCGFVVYCAVRNPDGSVGRNESIDNVQLDMTRVKAETGRVRRVANPQEVTMLHGEVASMERMALKTCRERVEHFNLQMEIVDCEFQFDRKKVTFYFDSPEAIDFRDLQKDLYRIFGARIWLENINTKVKNVVPEGALSHADKMLYAERGLRPPRH